jgi:PAS domain S-box-containing protein
VYTTKDGLTHDGVRAIYEDRAGNLWIGTYGGGLNRFSDGKFIAYDKDVGSAPIWLLQEDRAGNLWIGTTGGLIRFRDGAVRVYTTKDGLSHDHIRSLYEDRDGTLWIGTYGGGLTRLKDGRFTVYTTRHGLFDDFAWQILEDGRENLWISCDRGIFRVSKRELDEFAQGKLSAVTAVAYGTAHGMKSLECNGGAQPAGCRGREGRLWFPTTKGVVVVDADHLPMNELRPPVMIEQVIIDQQPISITTRAWLSPGKGSFEFHYTALSFLEPEKVRFKYKLEGYDEDWIEAGTRRVAYYTNIPPGDYRFRVIACNNDGVWNEEGRAFDFSLAPRFYQTRWFYALWIVIIGLLVLGGHRLRTRQLVRRAEELEAKVARRTVELAEQKNKLAEANVRLEKAHEDLLAVFNQWRSGVIATDADGSIVFLNQTAQRLFGQSSDGVLGRSLGDMLSLTKPEQARLTALSQSPPSQRSKMTVSFEAPAGRRYWLELEVQDDPRDSRRKIVFLYDLTEVYDLRRLLDERSKFHELVGESRAMQLVYQQIRDLTKMDTTVLIEGETGTGKELVARAVHYASRRKNKPFIAVNCAGLTESLLASQLFGHRRGAFTGAVADQVGVFEAAHEGTLFLDEIGDMPPAVQVSLLRVLQEREITRLGDAKPRKVDVRVIAATNRDLNREVAEGRFRQDVLYRIQVVKIQLPPLRERPEDIPLLVAWFLEQIPAAEEKSLTEVSQEAMKAMMAYQWPGNVRELKSAVESAVIRCQGQILQLSDLPTHVTGLTAAPVISESEIEFKRQRVVEALERAGGNRVAAARLLGISRSTLYLWLDELGIKDDSNKR